MVLTAFLTRDGLGIPREGDDPRDAESLLGDAALMAPRIGDDIDRGEDNGPSLENLFNFGGTINFELGLVDKGDPGSCNLLNLLFVSCQNLAETTIPRGPFFGREFPTHSCTPEVLPEETLSESDAVRSDGTDDSLFTEFPSEAW